LNNSLVTRENKVSVIFEFDGRLVYVQINNILVIIMAANFIYETRVSGDNHQSWLPVTEYLCHNPFLSSFTWFVTSEAQGLAVEVHELLTDSTPGC
jgi:hypothetical protein